jgi:hypothetical protein
VLVTLVRKKFTTCAPITITVSVPSTAQFGAAPVLMTSAWNGMT